MKLIVLSRSAVLAGCLVLSLCPRTAAQDAKSPPTQEPAPKLAIAVNSVLVPVVVRDSQGRAVGGLKREDFQIFEGKNSQAIVGFSVQTRAHETNTSSVTAPAAPIPTAA